MWLRRQLVALLDLEERSAHTPDEVGWETLPESCVLQLHWPRTRAFSRTLERHGFRVVVLSRHPLDVLISILHFSAHEPETARWLDGAYGDESSIVGVDPTSYVFWKYATSRRASALIDVSAQWWKHGLVAVRYEDLVAAPERELQRIVDAVGVAPTRSPEAVTETVTFRSLRSEAANQHFWQGRPNHWRELLPEPVATELAEAHAHVLDSLGYDVEPDPSLSHGEAVDRWRAKVARLNTTCA
jgi:Sulfotransferase domain